MGMPEVRDALKKNPGRWLSIEELSKIMYQNKNTVRQGVSRLVRWKEVLERKRENSQAYEYILKETADCGTVQPDKTTNQPSTI
jgi:hypothetical protein